jgi:dATP/dGTP diphosphohydrolase
MTMHDELHDELHALLERDCERAPCGFHVRVRYALFDHDPPIATIAQLRTADWARLSRVPNVGKKTIDHLRYLVKTYAGPIGEIDLDLRWHLYRQRTWSLKTFGPGPRTAGVIDHIRKELTEIEASPSDLGEWIDVVILAFDGAWRAGYSPEQIVAALHAKQERNEAREWPDWRTQSPDRAIEHVR